MECTARKRIPKKMRGAISIAEGAAIRSLKSFGFIWIARLDSPYAQFSFRSPVCLHCAIDLSQSLQSGLRAFRGRRRFDGLKAQSLPKGWRRSRKEAR